MNNLHRALNKSPTKLSRPKFRQGSRFDWMEFCPDEISEAIEWIKWLAKYKYIEFDEDKSHKALESIQQELATLVIQLMNILRTKDAVHKWFKIGTVTFPNGARLSASVLISEAKSISRSGQKINRKCEQYNDYIAKLELQKKEKKKTDATIRNIDKAENDIIEESGLVVPKINKTIQLIANLSVLVGR